MLNNNSIFNTTCAEFSIKWQELLNFHNLTCAYNHPYNLHQKPIPPLQPILPSLLLPYLVTKSYLQSSLTLPFSIPKQFFTSIFSFIAIPAIPTPKVFSLPQLFSQYRLCQRTNEQGSLVRTDSVLISPLFLELWTGKAGLTITDSLLQKLRKLMYYRQQSLMKVLMIRMANHPIHLLPIHLQPIVITSIHY